MRFSTAHPSTASNCARISPRLRPSSTKNRCSASMRKPEIFQRTRRLMKMCESFIRMFRRSSGSDTRMTGDVPSKTLEGRACVSTICSFCDHVRSFDLATEFQHSLPYVPDNVAVLSHEFRVIVTHTLDRPESMHSEREIRDL